MNFAFLDKAQFDARAQELFDLLYANMEPMVPSEFVFEEWRNAVGGGLKSPKRQIVLMNDDSGALAGFFQYYVNDTTFMMEEIQLKPDCRKKGLFRSLYRWLIPQFAHQPPYAEAFNHPQNEKSHGILLHMGLKLLDTENGYRHYCGDFAALLDWLKGGSKMYDTILFDLDGTLTDPGLGITNSVMHALKNGGLR